MIKSNEYKMILLMWEIFRICNKQIWCNFCGKKNSQNLINDKGNVVENANEKGKERSTEDKKKSVTWENDRTDQ